MSTRIETHIIASYPNSCLNRDDSQRPKTTPYGGTTRNRVSSQCWKSVARQDCIENGVGKDMYGGIRTKDVSSIILEAFPSMVNQEKALAMSNRILAGVNGKDKTLVFLSRIEVVQLAKMMLEKESKKEALSDKDIGKVFERDYRDKGDVCLFGGRMAANISENYYANLDSASQWADAFATHVSPPEPDFFSAIDDISRKNGNRASAHIDISLYTSPVLYRYFNLNLDILFDKYHMGFLGEEDRKNIVADFLNASILSVPSAKQNSKFSRTLPAYAIILIGDCQPVSFSNAFERPIRATSSKSIVEASIEALEKQAAIAKKTWGYDYISEFRIPELSFGKVLNDIRSTIK